MYFHCEDDSSLGVGLLDVERDAEYASDAKVILRAYINFLILIKPHIVGTGVPSTLATQHMGIRNEDRNFRFIGTELSFFYDIIHTKATFTHQLPFRVVRIASFASIVTSLLFFHFTKKRGYDSSDVIMTYILLSAALFLEIYSALYLIASKWTTVSLWRLNRKWSKKLAGFICRAKNLILRCSERGMWSGCMGQYNLVQCAIEKKQGFDWIKPLWELFVRGGNTTEVSDVTEKMVIQYIETLFASVFLSDDYVVDKIRSTWINNSLDRYGLTKIKEAMRLKSFDECVIAWHVATDICYFTSNAEPRNSEERKMREASYKVSNYMMYLLCERPSMMPAAQGIPDIRAAQTLKKCHELIIKLSDLSPRTDRQVRLTLYEEVFGFEMDEMNRFFEFVDPLKTEASSLALVRQLVQLLKEIVQEQQQWEVIRDVWMEMLSYAAVQCSRTEHAKTLCTGGELLTHYWLLLAHYGVLEPHNVRDSIWFYTIVRDDVMYC